MIKEVKNAVKILILFTVLLGLVYPLFITAIAQIFFHEKANGSIITINEKVVGAFYVGQQFSSPIYFWGRPSVTDYQSSKASNESTQSDAYKQQIEERRKKWEETSFNEKEVPVELLTTSGSNIDPNISLEAAYYQADRLATNRGVPVEEIIELINENCIWEPWVGEKMISVLQVNIQLEQKYSKP